MTITILAALLAVLPPAPEADTVISAQIQGGAQRGVPGLVRARALAVQMFASAGVRLQWCESAKQCDRWADRLIVTLKDTAPRNVPASARAAAQVFQGRDIEIYLDRMPHLSSPTAPVYWGHVLVHEITHLLHATDHHSPTGVMKAHWDSRDVAAMQQAPLPFTSYDLRLLRAGLAHRGLIRLASTSVEDGEPAVRQ